MQKGLAPIFIVLIITVAVALVGGGYYFYQQKKIISVDSFTQKISEEEKEKQVSLRIYKDYSGEFSVWYPASWNILGGEVFEKDEEVSFNEWIKLRYEEENKNDDLCKFCLVIYSEKAISVNGKEGLIQEITSHQLGRNFRVYVEKSESEVVKFSGYPLNKNFPTDKAYGQDDYKQIEDIALTLEYL